MTVLRSSGISGALKKDPKPCGPTVIQQKPQKRRDASTKLDIIIVGAGLGGVGAAIGLLLAGHDVRILEAASQIAEVGAGIQVLPNSSRVLQEWGLKDKLDQYSTEPSHVNILGWKGNLITRMSTEESAALYPGTAYWDFHRANLHKCLIERAEELGAKVMVNSKVADVIATEHGARVVLESSSSENLTADLVVGADGITSKMREILLGRPDPPQLTGDLAYRVLLKTEEMRKDPELLQFIEQPQVNYWLGPDAHAVNYVLRGGELFNMVLLVPDDLPEGVNVQPGNVEEMQALYKDWDPRIVKLLALCESVHKWRLATKQGVECWSHPSGSFTLLGDAVHATLPYLASGAGMALEDGAVLGELFSRSANPRDPAERRRLLAIYEQCRKTRTDMVVSRGNLQQYLYHLHDGAEQQERDRKMRVMEAGEALAWRDSGLAPQLLGYEVDRDVDRFWFAESPGEGLMEQTAKATTTAANVDATGAATAAETAMRASL